MVLYDRQYTIVSVCIDCHHPLIIFVVTHKCVSDCLKKISHRWYSIGKELGVPFNDLEGVKGEGVMSTDEQKLDKVLNTWIQSQSTPVAWETITDMLRKLEQ